MTATSRHSAPRAVALSGGVGGAKLVLGLQELLGPDLHTIVNTGDDFEHLGLPVCPDIDTLLYTLSGNANPETGWGRQHETWSFMDALGQLGGPSWFRLGDRDLATHALRLELLGSGLRLTEVTDTLRRQLDIATPILPMSDAAVRTHIATADGELEFQDYFVRQQARPVATGLRYAGAERAAAAPEALAALQSDALQVIIITPSNPWLSIAPILSLSDLRATISMRQVPAIGVSPIIGGNAVKGPTAKLMRELGLTPSAANVARHYGALLDGFVIDTEDADQREEIAALGIAVTVTNTRMNTLEDKTKLAADVLALAARLRGTQAAGA